MLCTEDYKIFNLMISDYSNDDEYTKAVRDIMKSMIKMIKKSDEQNIDELTIFLITMLSIVHKGCDEVCYVLDGINKLYEEDEIPDGCLNMKNPDGTYVTFEELGLN